MPTQPATPTDTAAHAFITRWRGTTASELSTAQSFVIDLCALLEVDKPHPTPAQDYMFERPVTFRHGDGTSSAGRIDCYRQGAFCLESKKLKAAGHTKGFDDGLLRARSQAEGYARALPSGEGRPPFVLVVDVGTVIEVYAEFSQSGATYTPFPDPRSHRIRLDDLARADIRARLRHIWLDPHSLNPARISARVTRQVADLLARLAKSIEGNAVYEPNRPLAPVNSAQAAPENVASFLTRCLFSMFAEDVGLLPKDAFVGLLKAHRADPPTLRLMLQSLWTDMDRGGFSPALAAKVLHFNGKLFKNSAADGYSLLLKPEQIDLLIDAAQANWREVEPAIFGTLLERALNPTERHALGAHYTPRAYVERLVLPTVVEPLRAEWANAQAAALVLAYEAAELEGKAAQARLADARAQVKAFHHRLCSVRVLDPACGSGNFLYVTLEHLKRLEGEVLNQLSALGQTQDALGFEGETVTLQQLQGIELNPRAAALAELVLWIGWLQWHIRTQGNAAVAEPVVHDYRNIECRDAVLAWDAQEPAFDAAGQLLSRWDGVTFKLHPVTGERVPNEAAQVPQWRYLGARQAVWPQADFVVGNPPFIGNKRMREALGDGYALALRAAWPDMPESADLVMFWWARAAALVAAGQVERMGLITTNSLTMIFNRRVVQSTLESDVSLVFAIPDHPWVDSADGAAVRIAMTVVARNGDVGAAQWGSDPDSGQLPDRSSGSSTKSGSDPHFAGRNDMTARLLTVTAEQPGPEGEVLVTLAERRGVIHADLSVGADVSNAQKLEGNSRLSVNGMMRAGEGFLVSREQAIELGLLTAPGLNRHIVDFRNGRDLTDRPRGIMVIDAFGLSADELRSRYPAVYQWLYERVKPERDHNNRQKLREQWWTFAEPRKTLRAALVGIDRYIATVETSKHRVFQFLPTSVLPEHKLIAIALDDAFHLGVLSSQVHVTWALATGGHLGVGNDPVYSKSTCFDTFPFPDEDTGLTPALRHTIGTLAEQIDTHRKRVLGLLPAEPPGEPHPPESAAVAKPNKDLTLTGLYNVLQALREGRPLNPKEKTIHSTGLVGVLKTLHDELDAAVLAAYGWPDLAPAQPTPVANANTDAKDALLQRLVTLNQRRALEEAQGRVRWLRPAFKNLLSKQELPAHVQRGLEVDLALNPVTAEATPQAWPGTLPEQVKVVAHVLASSTGALTLAQITACFTASASLKNSLPTLLQTLEALGRAQQVQVGGTTVWRA